MQTLTESPWALLQFFLNLVRSISLDETVMANWVWDIRIRSSIHVDLWNRYSPKHVWWAYQLSTVVRARLTIITDNKWLKMVYLGASDVVSRTIDETCRRKTFRQEVCWAKIICSFSDAGTVSQWLALPTMNCISGAYDLSCGKGWVSRISKLWNTILPMQPPICNKTFYHEISSKKA